MDKCIKCGIVIWDKTCMCKYGPTIQSATQTDSKRCQKKLGDEKACGLPSSVFQGVDWICSFHHKLELYGMSEEDLFRELWKDLDYGRKLVEPLHARFKKLYEKKSIDK